jgi:hypothetical protein
VEAEPHGWPAMWLGRPAGHVVGYRLKHVDNPSFDSYKHPSIGGNHNTHQILEIPLAKLPFLV